ncbi:MAG: hypothetical protein ABS36_12785 [Acidobacteria bacterium SCN 69-37]|nr:MAG: hypothetical protein ABS36_12785 [Acidobacteria bacterium SCN 69-37]
MADFFLTARCSPIRNPDRSDTVASDYAVNQAVIAANQKSCLYPTNSIYKDNRRWEVASHRQDWRPRVGLLFN